MFLDRFTSHSKIMFIVLVVRHYNRKCCFERLLAVVVLVEVLAVVVLVEALALVVLVKVGSVTVSAESGSTTVLITAGIIFVGAVKEIVVRKVS